MKADKLQDVQAGAESLRILLDRTLGPRRGPQIPGHYGNGTQKKGDRNARAICEVDYVSGVDRGTLLDDAIPAGRP